MNKTLKHWLHGFVGGIIGGAATAGTSWLAMAGAKSAGLDVPSLNWKALGVILASGAITSALAYLKQSPLPPETTDTEFKTKPPTLPLLLIGAMLVGCTPVVIGCKSTPAKTAVNVSDAARITVEAALGAWDAYIVMHHPSLKQQEAVYNAWQRYQQAQIIVLDAALLLKQSQDSGGNVSMEQARLNMAIADVSNALADMVAMLRTFGVKI